jgi:hypothetical protein
MDEVEFSLETKTAGNQKPKQLFLPLVEGLGRSS